ncbi:DegV family protein, partial [Clostridium sp.]|uniref:DegV family protein n=1 Tax=Clostridium sp. TaxID=1506 RepID=UPI00359F4CDD
SNAGAFIGTMLHIKPLLTFKDGKIVAFDKIRSLKRAVLKIENLALEKINKLPYRNKLKLFVLDSNDAQQAEGIKEFIIKNFPGRPVEVTKFSPVLLASPFFTALRRKSLSLNRLFFCKYV